MTTLASTGIRLQESAQFFISHCSIWSYLEYPKWTKIHHHLLWHVSESSSTESMYRFSRKKLLMQNKYVLFSLYLPLLLICVHLHRLTVDPVQVSWPALLPCHVKSRVGVKVRWGTPIFISLFHGREFVSDTPILVPLLTHDFIWEMVWQFGRKKCQGVNKKGADKGNDAKTE